MREVMWAQDALQDRSYKVARGELCVQEVDEASEELSAERSEERELAVPYHKCTCTCILLPCNQVELHSNSHRNHPSTTMYSRYHWTRDQEVLSTPLSFLVIHVICCL